MPDNNEWVMVLVILPLMVLFLGLLAYSEGFLRNIVIAIAMIIFIIMCLVAFGGGLPKEEGEIWIGEKVKYLGGNKWIFRKKK